MNIMRRMTLSAVRWVAPMALALLSVAAGCVPVDYDQGPEWNGYLGYYDYGYDGYYQGGYWHHYDHGHAFRHDGGDREADRGRASLRRAPATILEEADTRAAGEDLVAGGTAVEAAGAIDSPGSPSIGCADGTMTNRTSIASTDL